MNKKILLILVLVFSVLSIILIAVWGTLPDSPSRIELEKLEILDFDEQNDDGDKFKDIMDSVNETENIYIIKYVTTPSNATSDIVASTSASGVSLSIDKLDKKVYVIFDLDTIVQQRTITIQIRDKTTQKIDEITLWFKTPGVIIVPEI